MTDRAERMSAEPRHDGAMARSSEELHAAAVRLANQGHHAAAMRTLLAAQDVAEDVNLRARIQAHLRALGR